MLLFQMDQFHEGIKSRITFAFFFVKLRIIQSTMERRTSREVLCNVAERKIEDSICGKINETFSIGHSVNKLHLNHEKKASIALQFSLLSSH